MMLKVLMYLFENYINSDAQLISDKQVIGTELARAGFNPLEIEQAISWVQIFLHQQRNERLKLAYSDQNFRIFNEEELNRFSLKSQALLRNLEYMNIITAPIREIVIDRLMELDYDVIEPADVKWVVMMVLFHQKDGKAALSLMQDMVLHGDTVH
jgi:Smg protein